LTTCVAPKRVAASSLRSMTTTVSPGADPGGVQDRTGTGHHATAK
jgi:hypothetical protein